MNIHQCPPAREVRSLLENASLPAADLSGNLEHFFGCGTPDRPQGVVGVELYGADALLRSLVVDPAVRGRGCASELVDRVERYAASQSAQRIYLLTETAQSFFERRGYRVVAREAAPQSIRNTTEFSGLCPDSAVLMCKMVA